jgi:hypothetical protein
MKNLGAEDDNREFLQTHNSHLNTQTSRVEISQKKSQDLIFMQIDADCDVINPKTCKKIFFNFFNILILNLY